MKKSLDFNSYKRIQKFSFNEMNRWVNSFYGAAFSDGIEEGAVRKMAELEEDTQFFFSEQELLDKLMEIPGIGAKRAQIIADHLLGWEGEEEQ